VRTILLAALALVALTAACGETGPRRKKPSPTHDAQCRDPSKPRAFFYPSEDGRTFAPDDPKADGCELLVPDFLFCCPAPR
jgi:hypothetical protein